MSKHDISLVSERIASETITAVERDSLRGALSRRELLRFVKGGLALAAGLTAEKWAGATPPLHREFGSDHQRPNVDHRRLVRDLFGIHNYTRFIPGLSHFRFRHRQHPYDARTLESIAKTYFLEYSTVDIVGDEDQLIAFENANRSLFCAGGPISNQVSRYALEYRLLNPDDDRQGVKRIHEPVFTLAYEYVGETSLLNQITSQIIEGTPHSVPDWSIIETASGAPLPRREGYFDYLLITVLPQILDPKGFDRECKIVIAGGGHGVGTLATVSLLSDRKSVETLYDLTRGYLYWQALIPVTTTENRAGTTVPTGIDIGRAAVSEVTFDETMLKRAFFTWTGLQPGKLHISKHYDIVDNSKEIGEMGAIDSAQEPGVSSAPVNGSTSMDANGEDWSDYAAIRFNDLDQTRRILTIWRAERDGHFIGVPEPSTLIIPRNELRWLRRRMRKEGFLPNTDFEVRSPYSSGTLSQEEKGRLTRLVHAYWNATEADKIAALRSLVELGTHNPDGTLTKRFGGEYGEDNFPPTFALDFPLD